MSLRSVTPLEAKRLIEEGAVLVDVREADEHARERIPGARHIALSQLDQKPLDESRGRTVLFHCRSGFRTRSNSARLSAKAGPDCEAFFIEGGLDAWRKAGLPTAIERRQPIEIMRQVQIVAGGLVFFGTLLGLTVSSWFFAVPLFVGAGLMFAGVTGSCAMARSLQHAPWNKSAADEQAPLSGACPHN